VGIERRRDDKKGREWEEGMGRGEGGYCGVGWREALCAGLLKWVRSEDHGLVCRGSLTQAEVDA
jgi:hypothetical protein